jgi:S-DNA-T family DNA segregation ATPase FtsK/SpoIIIE
VKREAYFFVSVGLWVYVAIALYVGSIAKVGVYGKELAEVCEELFGFLVYAAPPVGVYLAWRGYKRFSSARRFIETFAAVLLFGFGGLIFQALFFDAGSVGVMLCEAMRPIIGSVGAGVFGFFLIVNGWLLAFDVTILDLLLFLARKFPNSKLFDHWRTFKEAAKDSFADMALRSKERASLADLPRFEPSAPNANESAKRAKNAPPMFDDDDDFFDDSYQKSSETQSPKPRGRLVRELEENKRLLDQVEKGERAKPKDFVLPSLDFLVNMPPKHNEVNESEIDAKIADLLEKLRMFKIEGDVTRTYTGPVVTTFEFKPAAHVKVSRVISLENDIAMALRAQTIRIQAPIPGKDVVGIEIPNKTYETIYLREVLSSSIFTSAASPLTIALGKDIVGNPFVTDLKKLPHLLIAGTTGSGKSVGINAMILSLLYRNSPDSLRLLMVDPKMLEFSVYNDIPHLLTPVITKPKQAIAALSNMVAEMERRYALMSKTKTKNIESYNQKAIESKFEPLPYIVVVIDELADLMMSGGRDVEVSIARLAQMARASGIHLIVATQRPSVDVITGLIKANLPSRISYRVGSKIDSKVILDTQGAESLLGRGDMLFTPPGSVGLVRLHAPFSSEKEIENIVEFLKAQRAPEYDNSFLVEGGDLEGGASGGEIDPNEPLDDMYEEAKQIVLNERKSSISYIQRRLQIGYNRAARIVEQLQKTGVLSEQNSKGQREIL